MFNKTSSIAFLPYGTIIDKFDDFPYNDVEKVTISIDNKSTARVFKNSTDIFIRVVNGIVMLAVGLTADSDAMQQFVVHRVTKINANVFYNLVSISGESSIDIYYFKKNKQTTYNLDKPINHKPIISHFYIYEIYAYYYQIRQSGYFFTGEAHSYWELTYVDSGKLISEIDGQAFELKSMDLVLYCPHQYHTQKVPADSNCSYITIMFDMDLTDYQAYKNHIFHCNDDQHNLLHQFMNTANQYSLYDSDLLISLLKTLLVLLTRKPTKVDPVESPLKLQTNDELMNKIINYINENIFTTLAIEDICHEFIISRSSLQNIFLKQLKMPPKQYINELKLSKSKMMIKEGRYTISEISDTLGFSSIHYFSRKFKQRYNINPTEYAKSLFD